MGAAGHNGATSCRNEMIRRRPLENSSDRNVLHITTSWLHGIKQHQGGRFEVGSLNGLVIIAWQVYLSVVETKDNGIHNRRRPKSHTA